MNELVRFQVNGHLVRLVSPPGHQILTNGVWQDVELKALPSVIGVAAVVAMSDAVIEAVSKGRGDADKITEHFLSIIQRPAYRELGFVDVSALN